MTAEALAHCLLSLLIIAILAALAKLALDHIWRRPPRG